MKRIIHKAVYIITAAFMVLNSFIFSVSASPSHEIKAVITKNDDGFIISLYIPESEKLTGIDFNLTLNSDSAVFNTLSIEGTDSQKYSFSVDSLPDFSVEDNIYFTYSHTLSENILMFSGYFLDAFSSDTEFYICNIIAVEKGEITEEDTLTLSYTLTCTLCSKTYTDTYQLSSGDKAVSEKPAYPLGDADLNGQINASDARTILRTSVGLESLSLETIPYINSDYDSKITASDARYSLRASVGLEKTVMHRYDITLEDGSSCEEGGLYTFICDITGKSFSMEIANGGHICPETDCFSTGKCVVCNEVIRPATGHKFDKNGLCIVCNASEEKLEETAQEIIPVLEEINLYDTLADEALQTNNYFDYIENTYNATVSIKKAAEICNNVIGMEEVKEHLEKAYKIRFDAFVICMDNNGLITANSKSCSVIVKAVRLSNTHIDYASYLND